MLEYLYNNHYCKVIIIMWNFAVNTHKNVKDFPKVGQLSIANFDNILLKSYSYVQSLDFGNGMYRTIIKEWNVFVVM